MPENKSNKIQYYQKLNRVVDYIHNHLDEKIEVKKLAEMSHFSPFHFHRITRALLGEPIGAYITKTRLETAAKMLRYSTTSIEAKSDVQYLFLSGEPINEKVVQQGPFVMNSETEILEAMRDYQMGKMGVLIEDDMT